MVRTVQKSRAKFVVGNLSYPKLKLIKSVMTTRKVDILYLGCSTCNELNDCVNSANSDINMNS